MNKIIIVLGSPNDDKGNLLSIAKERLDKGIPCVYDVKETVV